MTLADRLAAAILEHGPMAECHLATTVRKQRAEVTLALKSNPHRFVHNGKKARASRWDVRRSPQALGQHVEPAGVTWPADYDAGEDALCELVRQGRRTPWDALMLAVSVVHGAAA
jgi:hypothetical protein